MKTIFFNEDGTLRVNETIFEHPTYKLVMSDNKVTSEEITKQSEKIIELFHKLDDKLNDEQKEIVKELVVECNVLGTLTKIYCSQTSLD